MSNKETNKEKQQGITEFSEDAYLPPAQREQQRERKISNIKPFFTAEDLRRQFSAMSRQPFIEVLAELLQCVPEADAIQTFANENPDKWATTVKTMANLSGYNDKLLIDNNINIDIQMAGDAELMGMLGDLTAQLEQLGVSIPVVTIDNADFEELDADGLKV